MTHPTEAAGALRALIDASTDPAIPEVDRDGLRRCLASCAESFRAVPWAHPFVRQHVGRLLVALRTAGDPDALARRFG